jgi:hypothetical protein
MEPGRLELLEQLAETPFADRIELAAFSGRSVATAFRHLQALSEAGLVEDLGHATELLPGTRRFCLTARGIDELAREREWSPDSLLGEHPVSEQWRRRLLRRLDAVAAVYRLAASLTEVSFPIRLRWYRSAAADAGVALAGGRTLAILRLGRSVERTALGRRLRRLRDGAGYSAALVLVPDETRLRRLLRLARGLPFSCYLAVEQQALAASAEDAVWVSRAGGPRLSLRSALGFVRARGEWTRERTPARRTTPRRLDMNLDHDWLLPARLKPAEKRSLDLIADWPWLAPKHLEGLIGAGRRRVSQLSGSLEELDLVARPRIERRRRLVLTDRALGALAHRDRASPTEARRRWSAGGEGPAAGLDWREVPGRRARQLLRHIGHTESVHGFAAALSVQARSLEAELAQLDPPHRASRYFRLDGRLRSIQPDAFIMLHSATERLPLFLEWERRAIRPKTMRARLAPYLRYFSARRPVDDHGAPPRLLVVFDDPLAATQFLRVARSEMERTRVSVPLFVSDLEQVRRHGPLGAAWRTTDDWELRDPLGSL